MALATAAGVADDSSPVIPRELFVNAGECFEPGTKSLLELALASRDIYELLVPHLHRGLDINYGPGKHAAPDRIMGAFGKDDRFRYARHVNLFARSDTPDEVVDRVARGCPKTTRASVRLASEAQLVRFSAIRWRDLVSLDLRLYSPPRMFHLTAEDFSFDLPSLKSLRYEGLWNAPLLRSLDSGCPELREVELDVHRCPYDMTWPPSFVAKITSWTIRPQYEEIFWNFAPDDGFAPAVVRAVGPGTAADVRTWRKAVRLPVREFRCHDLPSSNLLHGLPPNLERLQCVVLNLAVMPATDLDSMRALISSRSDVVLAVRTMRLPSAEQVADEDTGLLLEQVEFWKSLGIPEGSSKRDIEKLRLRIKELQEAEADGLRAT
ncbi:hypothetical protein DFJ74DRAFT_664271 [Hyaloraphidium curvatum]|nr:hypothetical protein DFJ74DRAFT_664271 [Hyaloraphidium curvatum]